MALPPGTVSTMFRWPAAPFVNVEIGAILAGAQLDRAEVEVAHGLVLL